jgi:hypothetical protein
MDVEAGGSLDKYGSINVHPLQAGSLTKVWKINKVTSQSVKKKVHIAKHSKCWTFSMYLT